MEERLRQELQEILQDLLEQSRLEVGQLLVVGCSSSEVIGKRIGQATSEEVAEVIFDELQAFTQANGLGLAIQCCEHLNRALVLEREVADVRHYERVNVKPWKKAGGALASVAYRRFQQACVVEAIQADAGLDIGETLIGMHLKSVAVPLRLQRRYLGEARVNAARTRLKCIGGVRAQYEEAL